MTSSGAIIGGHWVDAKSEEFDNVRFQIIASLHGSGIVDKLAIWKIEQADLNYKYEKKSSGMLKVNAFVPLESLSGENSIEAVSSRGFFFSKGGMVFSTGVVHLSTKEALFDTELNFLMSEIAIGRSFVYDGNLNAVTVPPGYDSIYVPDQPLDRNKDGKFSLQEYQLAAQFENRDSSKYSHRYFLKEAHQVLPKYILKFRLQRVKGYRLDTSSLAYSSSSDIAYIDPITLKSASELSANRSNNFSSSTAAGGNDALDKRLAPIERVFAQAMVDLAHAEHDTASIAKAQWTNKQLSTLEEKVREINLNYAEVLEAIEEASLTAQSSLQDMAKTKLELCLSLEIELRRQDEQLQWLQVAMQHELQRYQHLLAEAGSDESLKRKLMLDFLRLWRQHSLQRNTLLRAKPLELQALSTVHGDMRLFGELRLGTDPFYGGCGSGNQGGVQAVGTSAETGGARFLQNLLSQQAGAQRGSSSAAAGYLLPALQNAASQEMESIQQLLQSSKDMSGVSLPQSIVRSALGSGAGRGQGTSLGLHAVLDLLQTEADTAVVWQQRQRQAAAEQSAAEEAAERAAFESSLPIALGLEPSPKVKASSKPPPLPPPSVTGGSVVSQSYVGGPPSVSASSVAQSSVRRGGGGNEQQQQEHYQEQTEKDDYTVARTEISRPNTTTDVMTATASHAVSSYATHLTLVQLQQFSRQYAAYRLSDLGAKKQRQLAVRYAAGAAEENWRDLMRSQIIEDGEVQSLYYSLPIFSKPPRVKMIYNTREHRRGLEELLSRTSKNRFPTLLIIRSGDFRFGAYLSRPPLPTCVWSGSPACFIFSLTLDLKIPFHARHVLGGESLQEPMAMFVQPDHLFLGNGDLSLEGDLRQGSTELENCYGLGIEEKSPEAQCLLAGTPFFTIDDLEVWAILNEQ